MVGVFVSLRNDVAFLKLVRSLWILSSNSFYSKCVEYWVDAFLLIPLRSNGTSELAGFVSVFEFFVFLWFVWFFDLFGVFFFVGSETISFEFFQITSFVLLDHETTWKAGDIIDAPFTMVYHAGKALGIFWCCQICIMWSCSYSLNRSLLVKFWKLFVIIYKQQQLVSLTD